MAKLGFLAENVAVKFDGGASLLLGFHAHHD